MRSLQRYLALCLIVSGLVFSGVSYAGHMYYIGIIRSFTDNQLVLDSKEYPVSSTIKVILRVVGSNGAIHEKIGRFSDVRIGDTITIKVTNGVVTDVEKVVSR
jgi:hypothetical protein